MSTTLPKMLTVKEVAEWLSVNPMTVYRKAQNGDIPAVKIGKNWLFPEDKLREWIESRMSSKKKTAKLPSIKGVSLIYLFGSAASGATTPLSDIDIAYLDDGSVSPFDLEAELEREIFKLFPDAQRIDLVHLNKAPVAIQYKVINEGKLLYKSSDEIQMDFEETTVNNYLDYSPLLNLFYLDAYKNVKEAS